MEHLSNPLAQAVTFLMNTINTFANIHFPGTEIPIIMIAVGAWGIYFIWKWLLGNMFDVEWKK